MRREAASPPVAVGIWILAVIAALWFLRTAADLLIPIAFGLLISYALEPVVAFLERRRVPRVAGAVLVLGVLIGSVGWGVYSMRDNALSAMEALPEAARRTRELVTEQLGAGQVQFERAAAEWSGDPDADGAEGAAVAPPDAAASDALTRAVGLAQRLAQSSLVFAGNAAVVTFLVFFLLIAGHRFREKAVAAAGPDPERRRLVAGILRDIDTKVQRYLLVRMATSAVVTLVTWPVLAWLGMPNALFWAVFAGVLNTIPYFGAAMVTVALFAVALVQLGESTAAAQMAMAALTVTSLEGWLLTPALLGRAERMSVLTVFVGLLLWTWLWGAWGTILAVPMLAVIKSAADRIDALKPVGTLMAP